MIKALKSTPVQLAAAVLLIAGTGKLLGALDACGTVAFLILLARGMRRERKERTA